MVLSTSYLQRIHALRFTLLCLVVGAATPPAYAAGPRLFTQTATDGLTDRLIVKYRSGTGAFPTAAAQVSVRVAANRQGVQIEPLRAMANGAHVFRVSRRLARHEAEAMAASLRGGDSNVEYAEPDRVLQPAALPNDVLFAQQWSLGEGAGGARVVAAWPRSVGSGITVAVLDTGVRPHADLKGNLVPGYDFIADATVAGDGNGRDADAADPGDAVGAGQCGGGSPTQASSWHGTHVAGIVAATQGNALGISGVAPAARLQPVRVLGRCGGYTSDIADALVWAAGGSVAGVPANATPARVINLSLGGPGTCDMTMQSAVNAARAKGAVVVVAAGNENGRAEASTPANCMGVVTVAATGGSGSRASYSNTGSNVSLAAPGGDGSAGIVSTLNAGTTVPGADSYAAYMGTSMAAPAVSGTVALMLAANPALTPAQVEAMLRSSARPLATACAGCGAGLLDAQAAVALAQAAIAPAPAPSPAPAPVSPPASAPQPAPTPAPAPLVLKDAEPNNTLATAQQVTRLPAKVSGGLATTTDTDFFRVSVPARSRVVVTLRGCAACGFGLAAYLSDGRQLLQLGGLPGRAVQVQLSNASAQPVPVVLRVLRTTGSAGSYQLDLNN